MSRIRIIVSLITLFTYTNSALAEDLYGTRQPITYSQATTFDDTSQQAQQQQEAEIEWGWNSEFVHSAGYSGSADTIQIGMSKRNNGGYNSGWLLQFALSSIQPAALTSGDMSLSYVAGYLTRSTSGENARLQVRGGLIAGDYTFFGGSTTSGMGASVGASVMIKIGYTWMQLISVESHYYAGQNHTSYMISTPILIAVLIMPFAYS